MSYGIEPQIVGEIRKAFVDRLDEKYELVYIDYNDTFNHSGKTIQKCIDNKSGDTLYDYNSHWLNESASDAALYCLNEIKDNILSEKKLEHLHPFIEEWLETDGNKDEIRYMIEDRDISTPYKDIIKQTHLRSRAMLYTNYDCLVSNYDMGNTYAYEDYFKDIVDVLFLNPSTLKQTFIRHGINTVGRFPNLAYRNGREAVSYDDFASEMLNMCCYGLLTFAGMLPLDELYDNNFEQITHITIPKDNYCGMFNDWNGGGSLMEMKLLRDLTIKVRRSRMTEYDKLELYVDERGCDGYCIDDVYGMDYTFWGKPFELKFKSPA